MFMNLAVNRLVSNLIQPTQLFNHLTVLRLMIDGLGLKTGAKRLFPLDKIKKRIINTLLGGHNGGVIPVPISNTEVKSSYANGIAL